MLNERIEYSAQDIEDLKILEDFLPDKIFDAHMHLYDSSFLPNVFEDKKTVGVEDYKKAMTTLLGNPRGLKMNIIPYPADMSFDIKKSDEFLVNELNKSGENVGEIVVMPDETADGIKKRLVHPDIRGLKCYFYFSGEQNFAQSVPQKYLTTDMWEVANDNKLAITLHLARDKSLSDPENLKYIKDMAKSYKNAKLILAHSGRAFASWTAVESVHELAEFDNVFFDFSAVCESPSILQIFKKIGTSKCMWGSDYPVCTGRGKAISLADGFYWISEGELPSAKKWLLGMENLFAMRQASIMSELTKKQIEDVFYNNAKRIFER